MNPFEKELRRLFADGEVVGEPVFVGRACFGRLDEDRLARLEFVTLHTADKFEALKATVLNSSQGQIDSLLIRFDELWGAKPVNNPNFRDGITPFMWTDNGETEWYAYRPTPADMERLKDEVAEYLAVFQEPVQGQGMEMLY